MRDQLTEAIQQRRVVTFTYQGHERRVLPAALGVGGRKHRETLHGFQVGGGSQRGGIPHWRNFNAESISGLVVTNETFVTPPGYSKPWISEISVALDAAPTSTPSTSTTAGDGGGTKPAGGDNPLAALNINPETAAKAADVAEKAFGALGKWLRKKG